MKPNDDETLGDRVTRSLSSGISAVTSYFQCDRCGKPYPMRQTRGHLIVHSPLCPQCRLIVRASPKR